MRQLYIFAIVGFGAFVSQKIIHIVGKNEADNIVIVDRADEVRAHACLPPEDGGETDEQPVDPGAFPPART
jgi:hypothetical protein